MIYKFEESNNVFIEEKFQTPINSTLSVYIWKSLDNSLGFNMDDQGSKFIKNLIEDSITILFSDFTRIESDKDIDININNFRGVSFWNKKELLLEEYDNYQTYKNDKKKNELLLRFNKPTKELNTPALIDWFDENNKITYEFLAFCTKNEIDFIVWDWSDFGIYFYHLATNESTSNIENKIKKINIGLKKIVKSEIPFY
ncbi:hypothetical protein D1816_15475 [Aquimarina sp. AD10]|uniref:hypothetical protein n=1 Tax=Aquimarina sp. AD10 TaxID=1714849 RepID=UPI000E4F6BC1|nr:hypothetical protein [Aquimarina sp. AD10]AXT61696.1 hypothetical protein D1816_15475 [Aquimarina sp. AD10]RKN00955.1 hypothetical protein D7033_06290 [Aquimarina sp. AD10]